MINLFNLKKLKIEKMSELSNLNLRFQSDINDMVKYLENFLGDKLVTVSNVLSLCVLLMQKVEKIKDLVGSDKKEIVMAVIKQIIQIKGSDDSLLILIPFFIDVAVRIDKGDLNIQIIPDSCCLKLFSFCKN
jgi:hypothetical protein